MNKFNVGVLGIGDISDVYIKNLKKYGMVNIVACAGRNFQKAQEKAAANRDSEGLRDAGRTGLGSKRRIMEGLLASASEGSFCHLKSSGARPEPLSVNFPKNES
jgi:hypothetical protein